MTDNELAAARAAAAAWKQAARRYRDDLKIIEAALTTARQENVRLQVRIRSLQSDLDFADWKTIREDE